MAHPQRGLSTGADADNLIVSKHRAIEKYQVCTPHAFGEPHRKGCASWYIVRALVADRELNTDRLLSFYTQLRFSLFHVEGNFSRHCKYSCFQAVQRREGIVDADYLSRYEEWVKDPKDRILYQDGLDRGGREKIKPLAFTYR
ncbi:hypothetical protein C8J35_11317 [Rhizobium sp. PP-F2F-G38]|nr:hypothetical protein C8J35_11317 [Rhizobium sp. PP-F2F-G38]